MKPRPPEHLLVATDLGPASASALGFAGSLAEALGARVTLFHAVAPMLFFDFGAWDARYVQLASERQTDQAEERLKEIQATAFPSSVDVETVVRDANPVQGILEITRERQCDLIVLGTHAWGPITAFFLGSVTQGVLHQSDAPVIAVRPLDEPQSELGSILCPVNISEAAYASALYASMLAGATGADLQILHLTEPDDDTTSHSIANWLPESIETDDVETLTRTGDIAEKVVQRAQERHVDLIVLGAQHKHFLDTTVLGTTTERIIRHAHCAVMAVTMKAIDEKSV
ncbi:MAG: universal stress protein [Thermoanaerobaculia bacterium]|nr:universal stress protein [Thermoanaerobaculia bacterium]